MKVRVFKILITMAMLAVAGCQTIYVNESERAKLDELHRQGISWAGNPPDGYTPAVKMTPAIFWSILPGAGQMFIANKMGDSEIQNHWQDRENLNVKGFAMVAFSWHPYVYFFTLPCGIGGVVVDVNRANNLKLIQYCESADAPEEVKEEPVAQPIASAEAIEPSPAPAISPESAQLLQDIEDAYREGLLTSEEYEAKRNKVLDNK